MAHKTSQTTSEAGAALTYTAAAAGGDSFTNTGREVVHVKNGGGAPVTVTVKSRNTTPDLPGYGPVGKPDVTVAVPAGGDRHIGPFPSRAFNDADARVSLTWSSAASVTLAVIATRNL